MTVKCHRTKPTTSRSEDMVFTIPELSKEFKLSCPTSYDSQFILYNNRNLNEQIIGNTLILDFLRNYKLDLKTTTNIQYLFFKHNV